MEIHFSAQHVDLTDALRNYLKQKLEKIQKHFGHLVDVTINIRVEKKQHLAEATILVSGNKIFATACSNDMYATFDSLVHKLDRQIIKHKEKLKSHHSKDVTHHLPKK